MEPLSPEEEKQRGGLTRERLVEAALELVNEEGLDGLSMRALADKLEVKASSLYWHVRDRRELIELLAESILESVSKPRPRGSWRESVIAVAGALAKRVAAQKDATRVLLEVPDALERSDAFATLRAQLQAAGLQPREAADAALMAMVYVIAGRAPAEGPALGSTTEGGPASIAIDSGSRGVILRSGPPDMQALIRVPPEQTGAAPAVVRGEQVVVRRLRGVGRGEIELNPQRPWKFKIQAPTWNTSLNLDGLDVREIWIDSGAVNVDCVLPAPRGVVPIHISSGVVNVAIHRPKGSAVVAHVHTGAVKLRLDDFTTKVAYFDVHWQSDGALEAADRYELDVSSGAYDFKVDSYEPKVHRPAAAASTAGASASPQTGHDASALEILLDGVESRVRARR